MAPRKEIRMKTHSLILALLTLFCALATPSGDNAPDCAQLAEMIAAADPSVCLIDLRSEKDYQLAHLEGFISQPYEEGLDALEALMRSRGADKTFYLMCYAGKRSTEAAEALSGTGLSIVALPYGYDAYIAAQGDYYAHGETICEPCKDEKYGSAEPSSEPDSELD